MACFDSSSIEEDFDDQSNDKDFLVALQLQNQFDTEEQPNQISPVTQKIHLKNIVDKEWELIDPNPNVYILFQEFNQQFFYGKLDSVYVEWSKRMTRCAGICSYRRGGECRIALSASYLTLRPRKDLVETLLHEMIHAYLFVTHNNRDRDGHGPEFLKHMVRINDATGTNITVYHSFHDEYDHLHGHWWRCTGPCKQWKPFYGHVKRSMNRVPSNKDRWWDEHERRCGGKFEKIKEPEDYKAKGNKKRDITTTSQISSPSKKKKKITSSEIIPSHGTIESFFKKNNSTSSSNNIEQSDREKNIDINSQKQSLTKKSNDDDVEIKPNYAKCPICQIILPKPNLFIHQVRCYK